MQIAKQELIEIITEETIQTLLNEVKLSSKQSQLIKRILTMVDDAPINPLRLNHTGGPWRAAMRGPSRLGILAGEIAGVMRDVKQISDEMYRLVDDFADYIRTQGYNSIDDVNPEKMADVNKLTNFLKRLEELRHNLSRKLEEHINLMTERQQKAEFLLTDDSRLSKAFQRNLTDAEREALEEMRSAKKTNQLIDDAVAVKVLLDSTLDLRKLIKIILARTLTPTDKKLKDIAKLFPKNPIGWFKGRTKILQYLQSRKTGLGKLSAMVINHIDDATRPAELADKFEPSTINVFGSGMANYLRGKRIDFLAILSRDAPEARRMSIDKFWDMLKSVYKPIASLLDQPRTALKGRIKKLTGPAAEKEISDTMADFRGIAEAFNSMASAKTYIVGRWERFKWALEPMNPSRGKHLEENIQLYWRDTFGKDPTPDEIKAINKYLEAELMPELLQFRRYWNKTLKIQKKIGKFKVLDDTGREIEDGIKPGQIETYGLKIKNDLYSLSRYIRGIAPLLPGHLKPKLLGYILFIERFLPRLSRFVAALRGMQSPTMKVVAKATAFAAIGATVIWVVEQLATKYHWWERIEKMWNDTAGALFEEKVPIVSAEDIARRAAAAATGNNDDKETGRTFEETMRQIINKSASGKLKKMLLTELIPSDAKKLQKIKSPKAIEKFTAMAEVEIFKFQAAIALGILQDMVFGRKMYEKNLLQYDPNVLPCQSMQQLHKFFEEAAGDAVTAGGVRQIAKARELFLQNLRKEGFVIVDWCGLD